MKKHLNIIAFASIIILINVLFSFADFQVDLTTDGKHSISKETELILTNLDDNVFIKVYLDGEFPAEFKHLQSEVLNLLSSFKSIASSNIDFEFINPNNSANEKEKVDL